ncbi:membrane-bound metal-dependent hydrolase [Pseudarthrobacter chlorophenolicus A6]|uniref:Membrane-bound metal-dependent hydrolase n=1 Tax=Pseudarthrobacter chlorophenolicus (strain ATCC 700700 / DSM 12829 / CIP 107037 / JCM 12360 / KCTC 9906 / NCIMB 13794 / A6) TaxID=452863 RepID=B8HFF1_PSECP|nr:metal-dependent hydrolase [Pseudarthrobacter chlorophenolicus]ACL39290.1 membrane-bound metal-dependent hydrolase [Pseudarthrobacter chlorophenolicus A6]SDR01630.1 LexA-binding, inner membrane-associated putative hydrolase [Pseudarthrobacter chlorophenolicus]
MGGHHAASGAAAWVAVASTGPYTLGWYPLDPTGILIGGMATAGTALVCDWDHRSSTVAHSLPPLSNAIARGIETASGGHRQGTHSVLGAAGFVLLAGVAAQVQMETPWGLLSVGAGLLCMFLINIAAKALKLFPKSGFISNWIFALVMAGLVTVYAPHQWTWLPMSMLIGVVVHIVGDLITTGGVPLLWPLVIRPPKLLRKVPLLRNVWRPNGALSLPLLGRAGSKREWLVLIPVSAYAMVGLTVAGWAIAQNQWPRVVAAAAAWIGPWFG